MILSMTGFGKSVNSNTSKKITIEIKSLNSKQIDLSMRLPSHLKEKEIEMRNRIAERLERGKVDVVVNVESLATEVNTSINIDVLKKYKEQIMVMADTLQIAWPSDWYATLLRLPDALKIESEQANEDEYQLLMDTLNDAIDSLMDFRRQEGEKLDPFFREKIKNIGDLLLDVEPFEEDRVAKLKLRMEEHLEKLDTIDYDKGRLEQELIYYIEKLDITEEKIRLSSHLNYFIETLETGVNQGKKLGFIAQEIGREINTLGSKSNNADMQKIVVRMKDELEQIKEQVLNIL